MNGWLDDDRYELDSFPIGSGGMGEVYAGQDRRLGRKVAVKVIRTRGTHEDEELRRRFIREAKLTAQLEHPGVPAVYDLGLHNDDPYLVMQWIDGATVKDLIAENDPFPIAWACSIAAQVCAVLAAAHSSGLNHRDLKPANIMLEPDGCVRVLDFGLAIAPDRPGISKITSAAHAPLGTVHYMAPEQIEHGASSPASDLYSLGCTLYEMLAGRPPFNGDTRMAIAQAQLSAVPDPIRDVRPDVPEDLERLLIALLGKAAATRPADATSVAEQLLRHVDSAVPLPGSVRPAAARLPRRLYAEVIAHRQAPDVPATDVVVRHEPVLENDGARPRADPDWSARFDLAEDMFARGEYRDAAGLYRKLAEALQDDSGTEWITCREHEATCRAFDGETYTALRLLAQVLERERLRHPEGERRLFSLRRQIALIRSTTEQRDAAVAEFQGLLADLNRWLPPNDPLALQVRADLDRVAPSASSTRLT